VAAETHTTARHMKEKAIEEFKLYWIVFAYLALVLGSFITYRRLVLQEVGIRYGHYGAGLIEAAVIAKVILIGNAMRVGRRAEGQPLIVTVLVKSILYALLVAAFGVLEHVVEGLWHGASWPAIGLLIVALGPREMLAHAVMVVVAFLPFFALWETARVLGPGKLSEIFLTRRRAFS
jgi:hypothetical protein